MRSYMSCAFAQPRLMIKLACFSDTRAPPMEYPLRPACSMNFHAGTLFTLLKIDPADGYSIGCLFFRSLYTKSISCRISFLFLFLRENRALITQSVGLTGETRYPKLN